MHFCKYVLEVFRWLSFGSDFEHHGDEHVTARLCNIQLDASNHADLDIRDFLDYSVYIALCYTVHRVSQLSHRLLCYRYLLKVGL